MICSIKKLAETWYFCNAEKVTKVQNDCLVLFVLLVWQSEE